MSSKLQTGALNEAADNHGSAGGNRGSAVGDDGGVRRGHDYVVVADAEGLCGDLCEDGVGALAELGAGDEHADFVFWRYIHAGKRIEIALAGAGESRAVIECGDADAALDGSCPDFLVQTVARVAW